MDYFEFCGSVRFKLPWTSLKYKYEYKSNSSEFYLYQLLTDQVYLAALNLGLNYKLCEALSMIHGFIFCDYGNAGWNAIREYFELKKVKIDLEHIKLKILKEKIKYIDKTADEEFFNYVEEMFFNKPKSKEVKLVLECYRIIKTLQPIKNYDTQLFYKLVEEAISKLKENSILHNDIVNIDLEIFIPKSMSKFEIELADDIKREYHNNIETIIKDLQVRYPNESLETIVYKTIYQLINE